MFSKQKFFLVLPVLASAFPVFAQDTEEAKSDVVVTATRIEQSLKDSAGDVTVISREQIEKSGATNLADLLGQVTGVSLASNGAGKQTTSIFIRGNEAKHTLVLIDGRRVGAFDGISNAQIQTLNLSQIERIEVLKGPASSLYGSDAIGGVIQIVTRKADKDATDVQATVGSNKLHGLSVFRSGQAGENRLTLGVGYEQSDGFSTFRNSSEDDGYDSRFIQLGLQSQLTSQLALSADAGYSFANVEFDTSATNELNRDIDTELQNAAIRADYRWEARQQTRFTLSRTQESRFSRPPGSFSFFEYDQDQVDVEHRVNLDSGQFLLGLAHLKQGYKSASAQDDRYADSLTLAYFGRSGALAYQTSLRQDFYSDVEDTLTGQVGVTWHWSSSLRLGANAGTAFRRPSFPEITGFGFAAAPNTDLKPESSQSLDLFVSGDVSQLTWKVLVFENRIDNLIGFDNSSNPFNQAGESKVQGVNLSLDGSVADYNLSANLGVLSAKNAAGQRLSRRPLHSFNARLSRSLGRLTPSLEWHVAGQRDDSAFNTVQLGGYGVVNAALDWSLSDVQSLNIRVKNLFGKEYELAGGYAVPEADVVLSYRHSF